MITFDRQGRPFQNFCWSRVMVKGKRVSFSDPARPPGGGVGCPKDHDCRVSEAVMGDILCVNLHIIIRVLPFSEIITI